MSRIAGKPLGANVPRLDEPRPHPQRHLRQRESPPWRIERQPQPRGSDHRPAANPGIPFQEPKGDLPAEAVGEEGTAGGPAGGIARTPRPDRRPAFRPRPHLPGPRKTGHAPAGPTLPRRSRAPPAPPPRARTGPSAPPIHAPAPPPPAPALAAALAGQKGARLPPRIKTPRWPAASPFARCDEKSHVCSDFQLSLRPSPVAS